jgi:hypothetical protein
MAAQPTNKMTRASPRMRARPSWLCFDSARSLFHHAIGVVELININNVQSTKRRVFKER